MSIRPIAESQRRLFSALARRRLVRQGAAVLLAFVVLLLLTARIHFPGDTSGFALDNQSVNPADADDDDGNEPDCGQNGGSNPASSSPVFVGDGRKSETFTALSVPLSNGHFDVTCSYVSDPDYVSPQGIGRKWICSIFRYIRIVPQSGGLPPIIYLEGTAKGKVEFKKAEGASLWTKTGGGSQYIEKITLVGVFSPQHASGNGDGTVNVYALVTPGRWVTYFFDDTQPTTGALPWNVAPFASNQPIPVGLIGHIYCEFDLQTRQRHYYEYCIPTGTGTPAGVTRLDNLYLNTTGNNENSHEAWLAVEEWTLDGQVNYMRLMRSSGSAEDVKFYYRSNKARVPNQIDFGDQDPTIGQIKPDVGPDETDGQPPLVMVMKKENLTGARRITQFRYHGPGQTTPPSEFSWSGASGQLKMVIEHEQIEYAYRQSLPSGNGGSIVGLRDFAKGLLNKNDGASAFGTSSIRIIDLASKIIEQYESSGERRVRSQISQAGCGCGGGTQGTKMEYDYWNYDIVNSLPRKTTLRIKESEFISGDWATRRFHYYDSQIFNTGTGQPQVPYLINDVIIEAIGEQPSGRIWATKYIYDGAQRLRAVYTPAVLGVLGNNPGSYVPYDPAQGTGPTYLPANYGLVHAYAYNKGAANLTANDKYVTKVYVSNGPPSFDPNTGEAVTSSSCHLVEEIFYGDADGDDSLGAGHLYWTSENSRDNLISKRVRYQKDANSSNDVEITKYTYGFDPNSNDRIRWRRTAIPAESTGNNGPGTSVDYKTIDFYFVDGRLWWTKEADGALTYREFNSKGQIKKLARNVTPTYPGAPPIGQTDRRLPTTEYFELDMSSTSNDGPWDGRNSDGGALITTMEYYLKGDLAKATGPDGVISHHRTFQYQLPGSSSGTRKAEVVLPHRLGSTTTYNGPAIVTWLDGAGHPITKRSYELKTSGTPNYLDDNENNFHGYGSILFEQDIDTTKELSREDFEYDIAGRVTRHTTWYRLTGAGNGDGFSHTQYTYDSLGRLKTTISPNGTITQNSYDVLDRMVKVEVGTNSSDMNVVSDSFYDSAGTTTPERGNGNLTLSRQWINGTGSVTRDTKYTYDFRDRLARTENPAAPHDLVLYDNLNRVIQRGTFAEVPPTITAIDHSSRNSYQETKYNERGLVWATRTAIDPNPSNTALAGFLESQSWYDQAGRQVANWNPNSPGSKTTYDGVGRAKVTYLTDRRGDDSFAEVFDLVTHASVVSDDVVFEQTELRYIENSSSQQTGVGMSDLTTHKSRGHRGIMMTTPQITDSDVGAMTGFSNKWITTFETTSYDAASRPIRHFRWGTFKDGFVSQVSGDPIPPTSLPSNPHTVSFLMTELTYNTRGLVELSKILERYNGTNPVIQQTKVIYDDLNRRKAVVENFDNADISGWDSTNGIWTVSDVSASDLDKDRVTSFVYDGNGNIIKQIAHLPPNGSTPRFQVTQYNYDVIKGTSPGQSDIASKDLLSSVQYPQEDGSSAGLPGTTDEYKVTYAYNQQGELKYLKDQNNSVHEYTRDALGRVQVDQGTKDGSTNINDAVRAIRWDYHPLGLVEKVRSYSTYYSSNPSANVVNGVKFVYTPLGQVQELWQDPNSDVDTSGSGDSQKVTYSYTNSPASSYNYSRLTTLTSPKGFQIPYSYGTSATDSDSLISRLTQFGETNREIRYDYIGLGRIAIVDYKQPNVQLDRTADHVGNRNPAGSYPGFDHFGRDRRLMWVDGTFGTGSGGTANRSPIVEHTYTYDRTSNRLTANNENPALGAWIIRDSQFTYDGLFRLKQADRGQAGSSFAHAHPAPSGDPYATGLSWQLDMLGNWDQVTMDKDWNGADGTASNDNHEIRSHNQANELITRDINGDLYPLPLPAHTYDSAGNLRDQIVGPDGWQSNIVYQHDLWNRLVSVKLGQMQTASYDYNGLNWRIVKRTHLITVGGYQHNQRAMYYDASWRLIEERLDDDYTTSPGDNIVYNYGWGIRGLDDIVFRRTYAAQGEKTVPRYYCTDGQFSTHAILWGASATVMERVSYDPYGRARLCAPEDVNGDGTVDSTDFNYVDTHNNPDDPAPGDIDRDGDVDSDDETLVSNAIGKTYTYGQLSTLDNIFGYCGYVFNPETPDGGLYTVRYRHYQPDLGRWIERDPVGYMGGGDLYEYIGGRSINTTDPLGLIDPLIFDPFGRFMRSDAVAGFVNQHFGARGNALLGHYNSARYLTGDMIVNGGAQALANTGQAIVNIPSTVLQGALDMPVFGGGAIVNPYFGLPASVNDAFANLNEGVRLEIPRATFANGLFVDGFMANGLSEGSIQFGIMGLLPGPKSMGGSRALPPCKGSAPMTGYTWNQVLRSRYGSGNVEWVPPRLPSSPLTRGVLRTSAGDFELASGWNGYGGLMPKGSPGFDIVTRTHVEGQAAALMQRQRIAEGVLYMNNPAMCPSCTRNLPFMLGTGRNLEVVPLNSAGIPIWGAGR